MKNRDRKKVVFDVRTVLCAIALALVFTSQPFAQPGNPIAEKGDQWELNYMVTIKGKFKVEPELGSDVPTRFYTIDRTYEGSSKLAFVRSSAAGILFEDRATTNVEIHIDDTRDSVGDPTCEEYLTVYEKWTGDMSTAKGDPKYRPSSSLLIDTVHGKYTTFFQLYYVGLKQFPDIRYRKVEMLRNRWGIKSTSTPVIDKIRYLDYGSLRKVKDHITSYEAIEHAKPWSGLMTHNELSPDARVRTLDWKVDTRDSIVWVSEPLQPDEPLIPGVPESKSEVTIVIKYALKRVKG